MEDVRILVVDDEAAERITLGEVLRLEGYQVTLAASGEEALNSVHQEPEFDLAILDCQVTCRICKNASHCCAITINLDRRKSHIVCGD